MSTVTAENCPAAGVEYWEQARHPLSSLVFLLPLLAIYEAGVVRLGGTGADRFRNGADYWMRSWLGTAGISTAMALPALVIFGLLVWHGLSRTKWKPSLDVLGGMLAESLLFAFCLILVGQFIRVLFHQLHLPEFPGMLDAAGSQAAAIGRTLGITLAAPAATAPSAASARMITFLGAGIYEEFMFRLCLLPLCLLLFRLMRLEQRRAAFLAVVASSFAFALAHHIGPNAEPVALFSFTFRAMAGMFFAGLFVLRGFGVTVGTHAAYDILVGVLLTGSTAA